MYSRFRLCAGLLTVLLLCLTCGSDTVFARGYNLPALGEPSSATLSPADERRLGRQVMSQLFQQGHILEDVELAHYLRGIGTRLLRPTASDADDFHFFVADDPTINAFALPGGYIGVNAGLIVRTANESELAGVLAHETAHVTQHHIARQMEAAKGSQWTPLVALLAAAIISGGDSDVVQAAITGSLSAAHQKQLSFTRSHEAEADHVGIRRLAEAHYNPTAMADFFKTMQRRSRLYGEHPPQILLSHPVDSARIADANARAADYANPTVRESADYAVMKERTRVLMHANDRRLREHYRRKGAPDTTTAAESYGYALVLTRSGRTAEAVAILQDLVDAHPGQVHYVIALGRALAADGRMQAAANTLEQAQSRFDDAPGLVLAHASILFDDGRLEAAKSHLQAHPQVTRNSPRAQEILARVAGRQQQLGEAYYRQALQYRLRGNYVPAIRQLNNALHTAELSSLERQRLEALQNQIIAQCRSAWPDGECRERILNQRRR